MSNLFGGKMFRDLKEKMFGVQRRGSAYDGDRGQLVEFDRFCNIVLALVTDFTNNYANLAQMHQPLFQLCDVIYPVATPARNHIVAIRDLMEIFGQRFQRTEQAIQIIRDHASQ